jgi:hypothetical protein
MHALPTPGAWGPIAMEQQNVPGVGSVMSQRKDYGSLGVEARVLYFSGLNYRDTWEWASEDSPLGGGVAMLDISSYPLIEHAAAGDPTNLQPGQKSIQAGGFRGRNEDPWIKRDNNWGFSGLGECGDPDIPVYTGLTHPGIPIEYPGGPGPCPPKADGTGGWPPGGPAFTSGNITRVARIDSGRVLSLIKPPAPHADGETYTGPLHVSVALGDEWAMQWIPAALALCPWVADFYDRHLQTALAQVRKRHHYNWKSLDIAAGWFGRIEVQLRESLAIFRGQVSTVAENPARPFAWWPDSEPDSFPEPYGDHSNVTYGAGRLADGSPVPIGVHWTNGLDYMLRPSAEWAAQYNADLPAGVAHELTITLDGMSIPIDRSYLT